MHSNLFQDQRPALNRTRQTTHPSFPWRSIDRQPTKDGIHLARSRSRPPSQTKLNRNRHNLHQPVTDRAPKPCQVPSSTTPPLNLNYPSHLAAKNSWHSEPLQLDKLDIEIKKRCGWPKSRVLLSLGRARLLTHGKQELQGAPDEIDTLARVTRPSR
jgi:hypothetical protein